MTRRAAKVTFLSGVSARAMVARLGADPHRHLHVSLAEGALEGGQVPFPRCLLKSAHEALKDIFIGTTAERTIRNSSRPVLMTNGIPAGSYHHVLIAIYLSECSADAVRALLNLGLEREVAVSVVYVIDAIAEGEAQASQELASFLSSIDFDPIRRIVKPNESLTAATINKAARECAADLLVVGTHGRTGVADLLLGSVAQEVLRTAIIDALAVPPQREG